MGELHEVTGIRKVISPVSKDYVLILDNGDWVCVPEHVGDRAAMLYKALADSTGKPRLDDVWSYAAMKVAINEDGDALVIIQSEHGFTILMATPSDRHDCLPIKR